MSGTYKDSLFRSLFDGKDAVLSLYNALSGTNYDENTEVVMNTLPETMFTAKKNDVSAVIGKKIVIIAEQQSSINENMPFRFLSYAGRLLENTVTDKTALYRRKLVKLPRPECIVLYNGESDSQDELILKLSDAFEHVEGNEEVYLELKVRFININKGHNEYLVSKCGELKGYVEYVAKVREAQARIEEENPAMERAVAREKAIAYAISYCKKNGVLRDFFEKLSPEEVNMLVAEWNLEDAIKVAREEEREEALEKGIGIGIEKGASKTKEEDKKLIFDIMSKAKSMEEAQRMFEATFTAQS